MYIHSMSPIPHEHPSSGPAGNTDVIGEAFSERPSHHVGFHWAPGKSTILTGPRFWAPKGGVVIFFMAKKKRRSPKRAAYQADVAIPAAIGVLPSSNQVSPVLSASTVAGSTPTSGFLSGVVAVCLPETPQCLAEERTMDAAPLSHPLDESQRWEAEKLETRDLLPPHRNIPVRSKTSV
ncbi:hypothetical protein BX600DRAFT_43504 [Xylariales sp. PMI_506]|nr:hypothetical protein BX600DRAFT_43504 [Xylariales sp. PMI_506]